MNSSNQVNPEYKTIYDPNAAFDFFKIFGNSESVKEGKKLFVQGQKADFLSFLQADKMYLLVEGAVTIQTASGNVINIEPGIVFGEFTPYTSSNATAIANISCRLLSLSEKQLLAGLKKQPEFLFMLMDILVRHLQHTGTKAQKEEAKLNVNMLNDLQQILGNTALTTVPEKRIVFQKGAAAAVMYVILEGYMAIIVDNKVIGRSGPGDIVGEIALVTAQHSRTASVVAETHCSVLAINRQTLLELIPLLPAFGISLLRVLITR